MTRISASLAAVAMTGSLVLAPGVAHASKEGRKNTTIGLGAAAAHQLLKGKTTNAVLLGAGAAYAYKRYKDADSAEKRQRRSATYRSNTTRSRTANGTTTRTRTTTARNRVGAASASGRYFPESRTTHVPNGSYYFTGRILNDASELTNRYVTVDHNGVMRRVYVPKSAPVLHAGQNMSMHELRKGDLVRVLAVRANTDRWNASKIELLNAANVNADMTERDRFGDPYVRRGGSNSTVPVDVTDVAARYNGTGVVERIAADGRSFDVRVGSTIRTVFVDNADFRGVGSAMSLREGDRVRVTGEVDGRDVIARDVVLVQ
ncbi:MAG: hypothetical protein KY468_16460 [Armatimonadetes bacterium]|nr:hypothetical protein [Armatimonadota bacterium]